MNEIRLNAYPVGKESINGSQNQRRALIPAAGYWMRPSRCSASGRARTALQDCREAKRTRRHLWHFQKGRLFDAMLQRVKLPMLTRLNSSAGRIRQTVQHLARTLPGF